MPSFQSQQIKLSDIITTPIQTGFQVRGKVQPDSQGNYTLIQVKDTIRSILNRIKSENLDKFSILERKKKFMSKYLVQKNDVLYLSKLNPGAFRYTGFIENTVPMAHFYILRPKTNIIDSDYLCWALNQDFIIRRYIQKHLKGSTLPFISKEALINLKIPFPSMIAQKKIVHLLKLRMQEKEIQSDIERKKNILINKTLHQALSSQRSTVITKKHCHHKETLSSQRNTVITKKHCHHKEALSSQRNTVITKKHCHPKETLSSQRNTVIPKKHCHSRESGNPTQSSYQGIKKQ